MRVERMKGEKDVQGSTEKVPSQCRSKMTTTKRPPHGSTKAHAHHRWLPSLRMENVAAAPAARTLRQSASFSGGVTCTSQRPGARDGQASATPARASTCRRASQSSRGVEDGATFCQDLNVQVLVRARPLNGAETAHQGKFPRCVRQESAQTVSWLGKPETRFTFDHVAGEFVTQGELFRVAGLPMVDKCMAGYNSCMFAYGQTGSGKTHTMMGDIEDSENRGMTPRVFEYLFSKIRKEEEEQKQRKLKYKCRCSFLEIYNEQILDLLEPSSSNLQMREDVKKGVFVEGLSEVEVRSVEDVLRLLLLGATNRKVAATNMNRESSRSHSVFTCVIESQWECDSMINFRFGRLNLVDLAGSERQKDTGADEERLREAASINKSLSTLGLVIMVLVDIANGKQRHVPYRDSKLTFLLQDSLGGNSKTTIIANISPSSCASSETLSTLKFAQRAKFIQNNAVINKELASGDVKGLQEQIHQLKGELARVRRIPRIPSVCLSEKKDVSVSTDENAGGATDGLDPLRLSPTEGSFLQFGRAVLPSPTVLNHKEALVAELAAERQITEHLRNELKKALEVNCLELSQAQHQNDNSKFQDFAYKVPNDCLNHDHIQSTENPACYAKEYRKINHQEAVLQLQMELASIDGPDVGQGYRREDSPVAMNMETWEGVLHASRTSASQESERLRSLVEDWERSGGQLQEEVRRKQCAIEALEEHLLKSEQSKLQCQEELHLCEHKAEVSHTLAQEKQVEVDILGKSVEELENTVFALESQVGLLKREGERQCLVREDMERELQGLKQQNVHLQAALSQRNYSARGDTDFNTERKLEEKEAEILLLRKKLEKYQVGSEEKHSLSQAKDIQKGKEKPKGRIGCAFRWFKLNHQVHNSELDEERKFAYERRIQELEDALGHRQNEITALKEKLADVCPHGQNENRLQVKKLGQLEQRIKALSGQQTKHHVKVKATGMLDCNNTGSPSVALEAVEQMKTRLESTQVELDGFKLKTKLVDERQRLSEMRITQISPMRGIVKPR